MAYNLSLEFNLSARPEYVMELLTDPLLIRKWSGADGIAEKRVGGRFEMFDGWVIGKVLKYTPTELSYTWKTTDWAEETPASEVHYTLAPDDDGTKVTLHHNGFPDQKEMDEHESGWSDYFFVPMEDFIMAFDVS
jgi:uncharacterized protein YndB with AHSA1/START domain